ncbi:glutathione S-transferase family protein [Rhizobium sp. CAU 1783]
MSELVFYTHPMSRGRIVRWMLEEIGAPYRTEVLSFGGTMKAPDYLGLNPLGKVPSIRHGDTVVTETAAICAYLADAFPTAGLAPATDARGAYYRWLFFTAGPLETVLTNHVLGFVVPDERRTMVGYGSRDAMLDTLERAVSATPYIAGDTFSAADVYVGAQIGWSMQFGSIEKRPAFVDYFARLSARPAHVRASEIDNGLIAQMKTDG